MSAPLISVIVPTRNNERTIDLLMKSLQRQGIRAEVIVVDFSVDRTPEIVMKYDFVKLIRVQHPGANLARNIGVKTAKGDIIVFTDGDCEVPLDWLENILIEYEKDPGIVCIGGSVLVSSSLRESIVACYYNESLWPMMPIYRQTIELTKDNFHKIRVPNSNNISFRRAILERFPFDEEFMGGYEEVDLLWRICSNGFRVIISPRIIVYHHHSRNLRSLLRRAYNYGKGHALFFLKHMKCRLAQIPIIVVFVLLPVLIPVLEFSIPNLGTSLGILLTYFSLLLMYARKGYCLKKVALYPLLDMAFYTTFAVGMWTEFLKRTLVRNLRRVFYHLKKVLKPLQS